MKQGNIVGQLLRRNISAWQIAGYAVANLAGLAIVLTAMQFYLDVTRGWSDDDSLISRDYLVVSKRVSGMGSLLGKADSGFTRAEIDSIEAQAWTVKVGGFVASRYNVTATLDMQGRDLSTSMFFESIPDEFFDVKPQGWNFDPSRPSEIPVIISRDYLALYNFGFAATRGLPQLSESMIKMVPLKVSVSGAGRQADMPARIVGFSSRLNTIAVPQSFMYWANSRFSDEPERSPSRLIVEVNSPGDPAIADYFESHDWEIAGDRVDNSRASHFLAVVTAVVIGVGAVISCLAFFILLLSIYLLLQKNRDRIHDLMLLGYRPSQVSAYYHRLVAAVNLSVLAAASVAVLLARHFWTAPMADMGITATSPLPTLATGAAIMALITLLNMATIARLTRRYFPG